VVSEQAASLSESEGVSLVDGQIVSSHQHSSFTETAPPPSAAALDQDDDDLPPPPPVEEDFPPPPPAAGMEDDLLPPPESPVDSRSSYAALVTPSGFVSPTETSRRKFTNR
jgi:hypothetical protein